ncbi:MAG: NADAR family protein [Methanobrevibacter sp.]|nr:NADAR family protein [Methanobrevibacter sp.]
MNDFITLGDVKKFTSDTFSFSSIEHALNLSKALYFERYHDKKVDLKALEDLEYSSEEENIWDGFGYTVLLNASYYKVMQDEELIQKLLSTGDEPLVYVSDDSENLFGRALMELRDEIRRLTQNIDRIDWEFTEYLKHVPWM